MVRVGHQESLKRQQASEALARQERENLLVLRGQVQQKMEL